MVVGHKPKSISDGRIEAIFRSKEIADIVADAWNNERQGQKGIYGAIRAKFSVSYRTYGDAAVFNISNTDDAEVEKVLAEKQNMLLAYSEKLEHIRVKCSLTVHDLEKEIAEREKYLCQLNSEIEQQETQRETYNLEQSITNSFEDLENEIYD